MKRDQLCRCGCGRPEPSAPLMPFADEVRDDSEAVPAPRDPAVALLRAACAVLALATATLCLHVAALVSRNCRP